MKNRILLAALAIALVLAGGVAFGPRIARAASCSVPYTFTNGTTADANQVNANFSALVTCIGSALTGITAGTNIVVSGSGTTPTVAVTNAPSFSGPVSASQFNGSGAGLTNLPNTGGWLTGITAGTNIVVSGSGTTPTVAVTNAPSFSGTVTAAQFNGTGLSANSKLCTDGSSNLTTSCSGINYYTLNAGKGITVSGSPPSQTVSLTNGSSQFGTTGQASWSGTCAAASVCTGSGSTICSGGGVVFGGAGAMVGGTFVGPVIGFGYFYSGSIYAYNPGASLGSVTIYVVYMCT